MFNKSKVDEGMNPWKGVALDDYENHMALASVGQLQELDAIMHEQFSAYPVGSVAIFGVAGGNGLANLYGLSEIKDIYGIDINPDYLEASSKRHPDLSGRYHTLQADINESVAAIPEVDMVVANLFIEYVGCANFAKAVARTHADYVSCVIQVDTAERLVSDVPNTVGSSVSDSHSVDGSLDSDVSSAGESFVSESPYAARLEVLGSVHVTVNADELIRSLAAIGYRLIDRKESTLPNGKQFHRLDFKKYNADPQDPHFVQLGLDSCGE